MIPTQKLNYTLNCKGTLVDLSTPKVMGILNLTPDSFYDGGKHKDVNDILNHTEGMLSEGATFIDLGGYSSRPGATNITVDEELKRVLPIIDILTKKFPEILISIDTFRSAVAKKAIEAGAALVNDISAGMLDIEMIPVVGKLKVPYIMMHMKGSPQTMASNAVYENVIIEMKSYFSYRIAEARKYQISDIIIDPGFGFAKNNSYNFEILKQMNLFQSLNAPVLAGLSRKSMIYKTLDKTPQEALNGTTCLNTIALLQGASILRVHDVAEAKECITLLNAFKN
ncbi:dihydropteroate synthase [Aquimarina intermedia]|uniref:Dihydropteroate synthase n=1 Tax=Aquimarina intermedia TaxID=350814 RepID=A0A5S5C554_9FLAO|nr:dihydropteroate synthase [Aquimarina intermedia]TYP73536.1 dihydropteroate synthase [Aquimarina intermedia]